MHKQKTKKQKKLTSIKCKNTRKQNFENMSEEEKNIAKLKYHLASKKSWETRRKNKCLNN